jgi:uncharacterized protein (DUF1330 family)
MKKWLIMFLVPVIAAGCGSKDKEQVRTTDKSSIYSPAPAYSIMEVKEIYDIDGWNEYVRGHLPTIDKFGGELLAVTDNPQIIEGDYRRVQRLVMIRWPDAESFHMWYDSPDYERFKQLRFNSVNANLGLYDAAGMREEVARINRGKVYDKPAYSMLEIIGIRNKDDFEAYVAGHAESIARFGGKYLAEDYVPETIEGSFPETRYYLLLEWPDTETFAGWYDSGDYEKWKNLRRESSTDNLIVFEGKKFPAIWEKYHKK